MKDEFLEGASFSANIPELATFDIRLDRRSHKPVRGSGLLFLAKMSAVFR